MFATRPAVFALRHGLHSARAKDARMSLILACAHPPLSAQFVLDCARLILKKPNGLPGSSFAEKEGLVRTVSLALMAACFEPHFWMISVYERCS